MAIEWASKSTRAADLCEPNQVKWCALISFRLVSSRRPTRLIGRPPLDLCVVVGVGVGITAAVAAADADAAGSSGCPKAGIRQRTMMNEILLLF